MNLKSCRICKGNNFSSYLNLGHTPAADSFIRKQGLSQPEVQYPLEVVMCDDCGISQLSYTVPPDILYQQDYLLQQSMKTVSVNLELQALQQILLQTQQQISH